MKTITPHFWFEKQAKEAADYYVSVFPNSKITHFSIVRDTPSGDTEMVGFELNGQPFMAIAAGPLFKFSSAISFVIPCETQEEIDHYWEKLSAVPEAEQCGWCTDKFGVTWQVWPTYIGEIMQGDDQEKIAKLTKAFLPMKKFDMAALRSAVEG